MRCTHPSAVTGCHMNFSVFKPTIADPKAAVPAMFWLSGLTCTDENFVTKAGSAFQKAQEEGIAIVICDTSSRNAVEGDSER